MIFFSFFSNITVDFLLSFISLLKKNFNRRSSKNYMVQFLLRKFFYYFVNTTNNDQSKSIEILTKLPKLTKIKISFILFFY